MIIQKEILIRAYIPADWQSICQIHDLARPDELIGSCAPKAFIPIEQDQEVQHLKLYQKLIAISSDRVVGSFLEEYQPQS